MRPAIVRPHDGQRLRRDLGSSMRFFPPAKTIVQAIAAAAATDEAT